MRGNTLLEWHGPGTVTCRQNAIVKHARFKEWDYLHEERRSEEPAWEADGTRRFVPEGPLVSEWGPEKKCGLFVALIFGE